MRSLFVIAVLLSMSSQCWGSLIFASGDNTPLFSLGTFEDVEGNKVFFERILGAGTSVKVSSQTFNQYTLDQVNNFYNGLSGVSSSTLLGTITDTELSNVDLLILPVLASPLTSSEKDAIKSFVGNGGTLFVSGEGTVIANSTVSNEYANGLLTHLGSALRLTNTNLDSGEQYATGGQIVSDPFTVGVASFRYGATTAVQGGNNLFLASDGQAFLAYEDGGGSNPVPEPATVAIWSLLGLCGVGYGVRRKLKIAAR